MRINAYIGLGVLTGLLIGAGMLLSPSGLDPSVQAQPSAAADVAAEHLKAMATPQGLVVHLGTTDGRLEADLARRDGLVVLGLASDAKQGDKARALLAKQGLLGRASILDQVDPRRVPLVANTALLLIADLDELGGGDRQPPDEKELLRVVRPLGTLRVKRQGEWRNIGKPWPKEYDDWPMYFHDAAGSDVSQDQAVGPIRGLQWHTGDSDTCNKIGLRSSHGILLSAEEAHAAAGKKSIDRLVARDAFSGIKLWERDDLGLTNRYAFLMDDDCVYLHADGAKHMVALDLKTGKDHRVYDQGIDFSNLKYGSFQQRDLLWPAAIRVKDLLVQVGEHRIVALDAKTGARRWEKQLGQGHAHLPTVVGDALIVVEGGEAVRSPAYLPGWNCCRLDRWLPMRSPMARSAGAGRTTRPMSRRSCSICARPTACWVWWPAPRIGRAELSCWSWTRSRGRCAGENRPPRSARMASLGMAATCG